MKASRRAIALLATSALFIVGCVGLDAENEFDAEQFDVPLKPQGGGGTEPPMGTNGLAPVEFWSEEAQLGLRELGTKALDSGGSFTLTNGDTIPMLPSTTAVDTLLSTYPIVMEYMIRCAVPFRQSVFDKVNGRVLEGWWGLAPDWMSTPTGIQGMTEQQTFATGCMIAMMNKTGKHVKLLIEGATQAIDVNAAMNADFGFDESTVHGNLFASTIPPGRGNPAFFAYLCRENDLMNACPTNGGSGWIDWRLCDNAPLTCGIVDLGDCNSRCIANGEHWECPTSSGAVYIKETVGVQLIDPFDPKDCR